MKSFSTEACSAEQGARKGSPKASLYLQYNFGEHLQAPALLNKSQVYNLHDTFDNRTKIRCSVSMIKLLCQLLSGVKAALSFVSVKNGNLICQWLKQLFCVEWLKHLAICHWLKNLCQLSVNTTLKLFVSDNITCHFPVITLSYASLLCYSMDGADLCFEIVKRASMGFVYSEAVARYSIHCL